MSRSRFYVDTPTGNDLPSQRHSMYVSHSEIDPQIQKQDLSSASSSATLPSAAGSVDRLTGLGNEKKTPRFFTLKPKTFSLRPFFSSSSIASLSPSKRRRRPEQPEIYSRRDSYVQTEDNERAYDEVGVQTLNASTVDVPVQTCSSEWEDGDTYNYRKSLATKPTFPRGPYGVYSSRWSPSSVPKPSGLMLDESKQSKNSYVAPLDPSRLLKYSAPCDSADFSTKATSAGILGEVKSSNLVPLIENVKSSTELPSKVGTSSDCSVLNERSESLSCDILNSKKVLPTSSTLPEQLNRNLELQEVAKNRDLDSAVEEKIYNTNIDHVSRSNDDSKVNLFRPSDSPTSVLKIDRTDSPKSAKTKTVHFQLSDIEADVTPVCKPDLNKPRNIDKDFEALLRDLDILTDEPNNVNTSISSNSVSEKPLKVTNISQGLRSALDALKQDFLAPIPETDLNSDESPERNLYDSTISNEITPNINVSLNEKGLKINITGDSQIEKPETLHIPSCGEQEAGNKSSAIKPAVSDSTSFPEFTSSKVELDSKTDDESENVYDNESTEVPIKTVFLPTLPSFFELSSQNQNFMSNESVLSNLELPVSSSIKPFIENKDDIMLSRSSSRSSMRSNPRSDFDVCLDKTSRFDSCENLDQLEEEIIRSLYTPIADLSDNAYLEAPVKSVPKQNGSSTNEVTHIRRAILDRLLSGESVDEIMPTGSRAAVTELIDPINVRKDIKRGKKYTATLSKFEEPITETITNTHFNLEQSNEYTSDNFNNNTGFSKYPPADVISGQKETHNPGVISNFKNSVPLVQDTPSTHGITNIYSATDSPNTDGSFKTNNVSNDENFSKYDFSNCLRPSDLQHSSFLAEISSKPINNRQFPDTYSNKLPAPSNRVSNGVTKTDETQPLKQNGQCDFASCLKPSQLQNTIFTAELSEITANKTSSAMQDSSRTNNSPTCPTNTFKTSKIDHSSTDVSQQMFSEKEMPEDVPEPIQHKSEITIVLQTPTKEVSQTGKIEKPNRTENQPLDQSMSSEATNEPEQVVAETCLNNQLVDPSLTSTKIPPPPPPPPPSTGKIKETWENIKNSGTLESQIQNQHSNLSKTIDESVESKSSIPKTPVMLELEKRFEKRSQFDVNELKSPLPVNSKDDKLTVSDHDFSMEYKPNSNIEISENHWSPNRSVYNSERNGFDSDGTKSYMSSPINDKNNDNHNRNGTTYTSNKIITSEPPPPGAVLIDKRITVENDKVHTDKYYALPVKEVLKETKSTTKFIPAPPKYEGIGPTEDGIPIGLRNSVKKENMHNWYKTMFKSLHKADSSNDPQEYIIGYSSEPESSKKDNIIRKKSATLDNRSSNNNTYKVNSNKFGPGYPPSAKSSIETYNVHPRLIEDYEPGQSSVTDDELIIGSKRFLPPMNVPKSSYEFKNGYEQDNYFTKKVEQPDPPSSEQQKIWYKEIQTGGEIPQYGLGKPAPEKPKEPNIGPLPPPPLNYYGPTIAQQATRPLALPTDYSTGNENGLCQQMNGAYEIQMRQAIHTELHQRLSPSSSQLSSPTRSILKSPSKSPDLKIPARALFDFRAESPKEIPLKKGDNVLILRQLDKNWYEGEKQGVIGIFPISYIEIVPPEHASSQQSLEGVAKVLYDFTAQTPIELSVKKHDTISLLRRIDSNWYEAQLRSQKGIVPVSYLHVLQEPTEKRTPLSSPNSVNSSLHSRSSSREGILKTATSSPSSHLSSISSTAMTNGNSRIQNQSKKSSNLVEPIMYRAMYSYSPQNTDELELAEGDTIYVVEICDDGWFVGTSVRTGVFGIFPGNYVEKV